MTPQSSEALKPCPNDAAVSAEIERIRRAMSLSSGDKEDLTTYAREIVRMREALTCTDPQGGDEQTFPLNVADLVERIDRQLEEWDAEEPRDLWWSHQHMLAEAGEVLRAVNEGGRVLAISAT